MEKSKLTDVLKTLSKNEIKSFTDFVRSPFFNKENVLIKLSDYLQKFYPAYNKPGIEKEKVFEFLYPGKKYNDGLMRNITSDLLGLAEKFLAVKRLDKNILVEKNLLLQELIERQLNSLFEKNLKKAKNSLENFQAKDENYYYNKYLLEDKKRRWMQLQSGSILYSEDTIQELADSFVIYFLVDHIKTLSIMVNQKKYIYDHNFRFDFMDEIDNYFLKNPEILNKIPYLDLFHKSLKLFVTEHEKYFFALRTLIKEHYNILTEVDRKNIYVVLANYCSEKINKGDLKYLNEKFELYREIVDTGAHYEGKTVMSHIFYKGVISNALELEKLEWTEKFINEYKSKLDDENRENCYNYCLAQFNYRGKNFDKALELLSKVSMLDVTYKLEVNVLQIMIYYDTDSEEPLYSLFDSFSHMLSKNKLISARRKTLNLNFMNYTKELFRIKTAASDGYSITELKKRIHEDNYLIAKTWLLRKVSELN